MNSGSLVGSKLGKYQIEAEIGRGGMGAVYKAYDPTLDRRVAIKILAPHLVWEKDFVERFMREARAAARLQHPNIVTIYDVGQEGGWYYYVMEYLEGQSLTEVIQKQRPLAPESVIALLQPLGGALDYAHNNSLVHRDIKPGNIVVGRAGRVSLTDFGIARAAQDTRLTATGTTVGTPEYMSPEQVQGSDVDAPSDQYSLAVVAYEMLSGRVPFKADSTLALMYKVVHDPPPPLRQVRPELPAQVSQVLEQALAKEPRDRYPTVTAFVDDLNRALAGQRVKATPVPAHQSAAAAPPGEAPTSLKEAGAGAAAAAAARRGGGRQRRTPAPVLAGQTPRPVTPLPAAAPAAAPTGERRDVPIWIWLLGGLTVIVLAVALIMLLAGGGGRGTPTPLAGFVTQVVTPVPAEASPLPPSAVAPSPSAILPPATTTDEPAPLVSPPPTEAATDTAQPSPTSVPTEASTATASTEPTSTPAPTVQPTATATTAAAPTKPPPAPTKPPPAPTRAPTQPAAQFRAPNLLSPADGQVFAPGAEIVLQWESVGQLPADAYYEPVVTYSPNSDRSQTWTDETPWVKETSWKLSTHDYLPGMAADGQIRWSVRVMLKTGENAQGRPVGTPLSPMNPARTLTWQASSGGGGGGGGGNGKPTSPPP